MANPPPPDFTQLDGHASVYRPSELSSNVDSVDLDLVVLCSWLGAATKHIAKYTDTYHRLFPNATILLIQSTISSMVMEIDLEPAQKVFTSLQDKKTPSRTLLHAFSNGGARHTSQIASKIDCRFDAVILDCCPGVPDLSSTAKAVSIALTGWPRMLQQIKDAAVYVTAGAYMGITGFLYKEDSISLIRRQLNDVNIIPPSIPRLYMYSKGDELVSASDVHTHAREARTMGFQKVREEVFDTAPHVALIVEDAERYWGAVVELVGRIR